MTESTRAVPAAAGGPGPGRSGAAGSADVPSARWLWWRWSWRDLRERWIAVTTIALVLAIGIGVFAGLGSTATWRRLSNDASFGALAMHDLRVTLSPGTFVDDGQLAALVAQLDDGTVEAASERLVVDNQLATSGPDGPVLLAARLVGMDVIGSPGVDELWLQDGVAPSAGSPEAVLEGKFADFYSLPTAGTVTLTGGYELGYVAHGTSPEDFFYEGPEGSLFGEGELAIVYLPLIAAQEATERPGQVNDLVLRLTDGADRAAAEDRLTEAVAGSAMSAVVTTGDDATAVRVLYEDIDNDQRFWNALSALVLAAAALAAFNLVSRIVEAQRREIGIGMALGVPRWRLAIRPMLVGLQVGVLGAAAGVGVGLLVGGAMESLLRSVLPMPLYVTPFQLGVFLQAAALGLLVPLAASAVPVWRAVRVEPIEAIRTGHLTARTGRLTNWTGRIPLPGTSLSQMPARNLVRNPRRAALTALGVGAAVTALVGVLGLLDSFVRALDTVGDELMKGDRDRVVVQLDTFYRADGEVVAAVGDAASVARADPGLRLPVTARGPGGAELDLLLELLDVDTATWTPSLVERVPGGAADQLVIAQKAADDLRLEVGDDVTLRHPRRTQGGGFTVDESVFTIGAIHANPLRTFAYLDLSEADRFGLDGVSNVLNVYPTDGVGRAELRNEVFGLRGVASNQAVARVSEGFEEALAQISGILLIAAVAVLVLALLIAFNASRITIEERRREHATMQAFGVPVRSVIAVVVKESVLIGIVATAIGIAGGLVFMDWMLTSLATTTVPDLGVQVYISPTTLLVSIGVGLAAVAAAPLFLVRKVRRMDLPATLRVVE